MQPTLSTAGGLARWLWISRRQPRRRCFVALGAGRPTPRRSTGRA